MNKNDTFGGVALIVFAGAYALAASNLRITSSLGIGPGLFPMVLAAILALLGTWVAVRGYAGRTVGETRPPVPLRGVAMIAAGPVLFGMLVVPFGVVPALAIAVFVSALANPAITPLAALCCTAILVVFCIVLFRWALDLPLALLGPWFPFGG